MLRTYFYCFITMYILCLLGVLYLPGEDHLGQITLHGNRHWHMNFRVANSIQLIEDRDIFYHHIGKSINYAKNADIIILGHSMALFGIDWQMIESFAKNHHIKIYNMASASDTSGEFLLRVAEKHQLRPAIWILNADDYLTSFFDTSLFSGAKGTAADVVSYSRWQAYKNVISKNIQWKIELIIRKLLPESLVHILYPQESIFNFRSITHGNWYNTSWPKYMLKNPVFNNSREPNCHAKKEEYTLAKQYIHRLGEGHVILTLVPYILSCRPRVQEIANNQHTPFISVDWHGMTSFDKGGHLDKAGAKKFTAELLRQLEQTPNFKKLIASKNHTFVNNTRH